MEEVDFRIAEKLAQYRFERSNEELQINLRIGRDKTIKITLCFSSKNCHFAFEEREYIEDLLKNDLSSDGWYLIPEYKLTDVEVPYFRHNNITQFILIRR